MTNEQIKQIIWAAFVYSLEERVRLEYEVARLKMKYGVRT